MLDFVADPTHDAAAPDDEQVDLAWLKRRALAFEKHISRNAEQRAKHEAEPARFMESEADLDAAIRGLSVLTEHPALYGAFAGLGCAASLVGLLAHENADIAIAAVEILAELTGDDVGADEAQWGALVDALLEADLLGLLRSNLQRLDERDEADRPGVYHALALLENLCSRPDTAETVGDDAALLRWLLDRARQPERPVSQNKQYAAEMLAILVQNSPRNRQRLADLDAVDTLLQLAAAYRRADPARDGEEEEYMENLFGALSALVDEPAGKAKFVEAEGVELCLLMLKDGKASRPAALRLLDHAAAGGLASDSDSDSSADVCRKLVDAGGLKTLFTLFMRSSRRPDRETTEHLVSLFARLLRLLPSGSAERIRALAKFVERDYEKTARLVALRRVYAARVAAVDAQRKQEKKQKDLQQQQQQQQGREDGEEADEDDRADAWFSRRLDAGLFCLQTIDLTLGFLVAEDAGAKQKIEQVLAEQGEALAVVRKSIQEQMEDADADTDDAKANREMLSMLLEYLEP